MNQIKNLFLVKTSDDENKRNSDLGTPNRSSKSSPASPTQKLFDSSLVQPISFQPNSEVNEVEFLKDLVYRLNAQLAKYHEKHPSEVFDCEIDVNKFKHSEIKGNLLHPLFLAYDERIRELESSINFLQSENKTLQMESKAIKLENARLHEQIKEKLGSMSAVDGYTYSDWGLMGTRDGANDRIRMLTEENDLLLSRQQKMSDEYIMIKEELEEAKQNVHDLTIELDDARANLQNIRDYSNVDAKSKELFEKEMARRTQEAQMYQIENGRLVDDVETLRKDLETALKELQEKKKMIVEMTIAYKSGVQDLQRFAQKEEDMLRDLHQVESRAEEFSNLYSQVLGELEIVQQEKQDFLIAIKSLQDEVNDYQDRYDEMQSRVDRAVEDAKVAVLEQERLQLREKQLEKELSRLEERLKRQKQSSDETIKTQVETIKNTFKSERKQILEELNSLQFEKAEIQIQLDRAVREKRVAEQEAEKLKKILPAEFERLHGTIDEYQQRIRRFEGERSDAGHKLESLQVKMSREENKYVQERQLFTEQIDKCNQRIRVLERECGEAKNENLTLFTRLQEIDKQGQLKSEELLALKKEYTVTVQQMERKFEFERKEMDHKLKQGEAVIEKLSKEIQELLSQQQKMAHKWKDDAKENSKNFEQIISDLHQKLRQGDEKYSELNKHCVQLTVIKDELSRQLEEAKKMHAKMHFLLTNAEAKANGTAQQVRILLAREQELMNEIKSLQRTVDQLTLENKRISRQNQAHEKRFSGSLMSSKGVYSTSVSRKLEEMSSALSNSVQKENSSFENFLE